jgi:hypothetical protein
MDDICFWTYFKMVEEKIEDIKRESERKETSGLDEGETDNEAKLAFRYRPNTNRRNGGKRSRRKADRESERLLSFFNRMQESREVQRSLWGVGSSVYTFENGTPFSDKDESS